MSWSQDEGDTRCYPLFGVVPVLNMPFDSELRIDYKSLERLIERTLGDGVSGVLVPAVASEVETLTNDERLEVVRFVANSIGGRLPVIAGVSSDHLKTSQLLADGALAAGCAGILCRAPAAIETDDDAVAGFFSGLATVGAGMLMIQDLAWRGPGLSVPLILRLFDEVPSFKCLKVETAPAGPKYTQVLEATDGRMNVSCGWGMAQMIEALDRGVHGYNTTAVNRPFVQVYQHYRHGRRHEAVDLFNDLLPMLSWVQQDLLVSIHFFKRYCVRRGEFRTDAVRLTGTAFDTHHQRICEELLDYILELESHLGEQEAAMWQHEM